MQQLDRGNEGGVGPAMAFQAAQPRGGYPGAERAIGEDGGDRETPGGDGAQGAPELDCHIDDWPQ